MCFLPYQKALVRLHSLKLHAVGLILSSIERALGQSAAYHTCSARPAIRIPLGMPRLLTVPVIMIGLTACIPVAREFLMSPPIQAVYTNATGQPVRGVEFALSVSFDADTLCANPGALRVTTDSLGAFAFPATHDRESFIILLPIDRSQPPFSLCVNIADTMRAVLTDYASSGRPYVIACTEALGQTHPVVCARG